MNNGRGCAGPTPWDRNFKIRPTPRFRGGFAPCPPAFFPGGPPPWRRGGPPGLRGRGRERLSYRGGVTKRGNHGGKVHWNNKTRNNMPGKRLNEEEIGVTEYISSHVGFSGIIKSRYSDFQVNEINLAGEVAQLTSEEVPEPAKKEEICEDEDLLNKYNLELLPLETWDNINSLALSHNPTKQRVEIDVTGMSKEDRTKIHDAVKKAFGDSVVGSTVTTNDKKLVRFEKYRKGARIDNRVKWLWSGEYVHFIVHKQNCDTMDAATKIAQRLMMLNVKPSQLGYAGTKDRRGKTSQWFSLRRIEPKRISSACSNMREIHVGNFTFSNTHLKLGMLKGNRFRLALRNVTASDDVIAAACTNLRDNGFLNYYGLQRFGTRADVPTYTIGLKLLQGNFQEAAKLIIGEDWDGVVARERHTHRRNSLEGRMLKALAKSPNDFVGAIGALPRNIRLLYVHSYQSLVWNKVVSERVRSLGLCPVPGDLVLVEPTQHTEHILEEEIEYDDDEETNGDEKLDEEKLEENTDTQTSTDTDKTVDKGAENKNQTKKETKRSAAVHVLTEEDVASGKYSLRDVVLPLPGYSVQYPPNMQHYYTSLLKQDNLTLDLKHKIPAYSMSGTYRAVSVRVEGLEWETVRYDSPHVDLIRSDLDLLHNIQLVQQPSESKYKALLLTMSLPASCYATMALRELLRMDTSGEAHARLNDYHIDKSADVQDTVKTEQDIKIESEDVKLESDSGENADNEETQGKVVIGEGGEERKKRKLEDAETVTDKRSKAHE